MNPKRHALLSLSVVFLFGLLAPRSVHATTARPGFQKVRIGHLFLQPNASAPAQIIVESDAELV